MKGEKILLPVNASFNLLRGEPPLFLNYHVELAEGVGLVGEVLGHGRNAEEDAIGRGLDGLSVGHELEEAEPTVAAIASAEVLGVEHHLMHVLPC